MPDFIQVEFSTGTTESAPLGVRREVGLQVEIWKLQHKIGIEATGTDGIAWGKWRERRIQEEPWETSRARQRERSHEGEERRTAGSLMEGEISSFHIFQRASQARIWDAALCTVKMKLR